MELNCDVGEINREVDDAILPFVSAVNVSCLAHAGDEELVRGTVSRAIELGITIGSHPSWPDRENFGRRSMDLSAEQLRDSLERQIRWLRSVVQQAGGRLETVKPHGALYHDANSNPVVAAAILDAIKNIDAKLVLVGMAGSTIGDDCQARGIGFLAEAFADRRYETAMRLCSRSDSKAVIDNVDDFKKQLNLLADGKVRDVQGRIHSVNAETVCLHSDTANAAQYARIAHEFFRS